MGLDISERDRADRRRGVRLAVPQILSSSASLVEAAPHLLRAVGEGLDWDLGVLWLADDPAGALRCLDAWHAPSVRAEDFLRASRGAAFAAGVGLPGRVWETGRPTWIPRLARDVNFPRAPVALPAGIQSAFACPIASGGEVQGVVEFFSRAAREPDPDLLEMMTTVGGQIGQFLHRMQAESELRQSEARKAAILEAALDCIITIDHEERILEFNPAAEKTFGHARAAVLGRRLSELIIPPAHRAAHHAGMRRYLTTGEGRVLGRRVEMPALRQDGSEFPVEISIVPTVLDGRPIFTGYLRDITDRKCAEREVLQLNRALEERVEQRTAELSAANEQLARAARLKDEFLATVSHELRTPLNGVIGMVELLADTPLDAEQQRYLRVARTSADLLRGVISDLLDFSRIESGKLELQPGDFNPAEVVEEVVGVLALQVEQKRLELACRIDPDVERPMRGDRGRLRQVLLNLAANAVKFTPRGRVEVRACVQAREAGAAVLRFTVTDTGIGIPQDRLGLLFQPFSQVDAATTRRFGGSGLGLAIARRLTELMGGQIGVESVLGQGSTFWFTARLGPPSGAPETGGADASPAAPALPRTAGPLRILVAEDNPANQMVAAALLDKLGHRARFAGNGREAIAAFEQEPFDLILMDVQMPEMDGLEATAAIREREAGRGRRTPIVALTAHVLRGERERYLAGGMDGYLSKPLNRQDLIRTLERWGAAAPAPAEGAAGVPAPLVPAEVVINRQAVLARLDGDERLLLDLVEMYLQQWPRLFAELLQALQEDDLPTVTFKAHRLNGLARTFEAREAVDAALRVEDLCAAGDRAQVRAAGGELERAFRGLENTLKKLPREPA
jgi:PAS domain S-box-containing protein